MHVVTPRHRPLVWLVFLAGLVAPCAQGQELTPARYAGGVDGAAELCASAFPRDAAAYRDAFFRSAQCHTDRAAFERWRLALRQHPKHAAEYRKGVQAVQADFAASAKGRAAQCQSLLSMPCEPAAGPLNADDLSR